MIEINLSFHYAISCCFSFNQLNKVKKKKKKQTDKTKQLHETGCIKRKYRFKGIFRSRTHETIKRVRFSFEISNLYLNPQIQYTFSSRNQNKTILFNRTNSRKIKNIPDILSTNIFRITIEE